MGQMIWRVEFDGIDLTMKNMFSRPRKVNNILDTYGCFAFHSGLLAMVVHQMKIHIPCMVNFCCADLDTTWLEFSEDEVIIGGEYEYCQGFGFKYLARPSVSLKANATNIKISMQVKKSYKCRNATTIYVSYKPPLCG